MDLKGKKINFLGDSITEGVGTSDVSRGYVALVAGDCECITRNYGIGGTRIARQYHPSENARHDLDFNSRVAQMDPDADIVAVCGGTNDFGHGDAPIGTMADRTRDTFYGGLHELFTQLIEKYPEAKIVVFTPLHRCNEDNPRGDGFKAQDVGDLKFYTNIIREVAEWYSLPVLDLFAQSGMQPRVPVIKEKYVPDGLHPNDAGNRILADLVIAFLKNL